MSIKELTSRKDSLSLTSKSLIALRYRNLILKVFENVVEAIVLFCGDIQPDKKIRFQEILGTPRMTMDEEILL